MDALIRWLDPREEGSAGRARSFRSAAGISSREQRNTPPWSKSDIGRLMTFVLVLRS